MKSNNHGITLIELIIGLAILSIVFVLGFSYYLFGIKAFDGGDKQSNMQYTTRMASKFITDEVRNAKKLELVSIPSTFANDHHYIYIQDSTLKHRFNGVVTDKTGAVIEELTPMFRITKLPNGNNLLTFRIKSSKNSALGQKSDQIESKVLLNNVKGLSPHQEQAIKYQKP